MAKTDHLEKRFQKDIFTRGEISKLADFETRTDANHRIREEDKQEAKPAISKAKRAGAALLAAIALGAGASIGGRIINGGETPHTLTPAELNDYVAEHGHLPPGAG